MPKNLWFDSEAREFRDRYAAEWGEALALRVYTSRLIGRDPDLVLHGGGNTSVKIRKENLVGDRVEALCVKGSGWDPCAAGAEHSRAQVCYVGSHRRGGWSGRNSRYRALCTKTRFERPMV